MALVAMLALALTPAPPVPRPDAVGSCSFGRIEVVGNRVSIAGSSWAAEGTIKGRWAHVTWTSASGRKAVAAYFMDDDDWNGGYGYVDEECDPIVMERFAVRWE